jgi:hypothetical protein
LCYVKSESFNGFINKKGEKILDSTPFKFCEKFYGQLARFDGIIKSDEEIRYLLRMGIDKFIAKSRRHLVSITENGYPIKIIYKVIKK